MYFYRIDVTLSEACWERLDAETAGKEGREEFCERRYFRKMMLDTVDFNEGLEHKLYFVSNIDNGQGTMGAVSKKEPIDTGEMNAYLEKLRIEITDESVREIALGDILNLFQRIERRCHHMLNEQFYEMVPLESRFEHREILGRLTEDDVFSDEEEECGNERNRFVSRPLREELERVCSMDAREEWIGHPVHYLIESDDAAFCNYAATTLMRALYRKGRITSRKYMGLSIRDLSGFVLDTVYHFCEKGCLFLGIDREEEDDSPYACADMGDIICSVKWMKKFRNRTLTFFQLPRSCNKIKELLYDHAAGCTFVEITEDTLEGEQAKAYLTMLAEDHHTQADEHLFENLEEEQAYLPHELKELFERWFGTHLKRHVFPAYAQLACAEAAEAGKKPQGDAYDQLQRMIGLGDAKRVIDEALDYYKVQKLYKERGMAESRPVMHMVFAGNPGTAKTTVARLFAQIMKDNGLLSEGKLYEVGRADLVGLYVGSTAKQVKEAFKKAKGSVLFIDEAYSLVDDRRGLYGDEAINTIVQEMENNSKDMVVILAGYPDEMERLISRNPGLRSRIAFHVPFADYDEEELYGITKLIAEEKGLRLSAGVKKKLLPIFAEARETKEFGNGRYARNLIEKAQMSQASRLARMDCETVTDKEVATLRAEDFTAIRLGGSVKKHAIGF